MPLAVATMGRMAERITLEQLARNIGDLGTIIQAGFAFSEEKFGYFEARFNEFESRFNKFETKFDKELRDVKDRLSRVEYGLRELQKDFIALGEEVRGIHKVIDNINIRVVALERNLGASPLFPAG
jgi:hypothetical protein